MCGQRVTRVVRKDLSPPPIVTVTGGLARVLLTLGRDFFRAHVPLPRGRKDVVVVSSPSNRAHRAGCDAGHLVSVHEQLRKPEA